MPATQPTVSCLYTTVQNLEAASRFFGFLGRHGKTLEAGEQYTMRGDLNTLLAGRDSDRYHQALERALEGFTDASGTEIDPSLAIIKTPSVFLFDDTTNLVKAVRLDNGTLGVADACTGSFSVG